MRVMEILYRAKIVVHAFGYNSTKREPILMKTWSNVSVIGGWLWQILGAIHAVATVCEAVEIWFFFVH